MNMSLRPKYRSYNYGFNSNGYDEYVSYIYDIKSRSFFVKYAYGRGHYIYTCIGIMMDGKPMGDKMLSLDDYNVNGLVFKYKRHYCSFRIDKDMTEFGYINSFLHFLIESLATADYSKRDICNLVGGHSFRYNII